MAQDLGPGELGGGRPARPGRPRLLEVGPVELDPAAAGLDQRAGPLGVQPGDVGGGQLDVVEDRRPRDVAELAGAHDRVAGRLSQEAQRRRRAAADRAGTRTSKPAASSEAPVTVISSQAFLLVEVDLAPALAARPQQGGEDAFEAGAGRRPGAWCRAGR